ncbi:NAD-dependent epimerase/dehydratase family protein [Candidatus Pelagibacter communis]|uniref:NAD-dependent epimerase/dehydratase family protein n=1 Tax=Candidatus Pelagibacter TaxID=198251 RepID=UPI003EE23EE9
MTRILIIGKKSFLGSNLNRYLSKKFETVNLSFKDIKKKNVEFFKKFTHVINTSISPNYVNKKYNSKHDTDFNFIEKFKKINFYYIFFNTRKIYALKKNITEKSKIRPKDNYARNKLITEKYLRKKIKKRLVCLRISNVIGHRIFKNSANSHKLFFDNFLIYREKYQKKKKINVYNDFKDFLSIDQFCKIILKIIKLKIYGVFNVSISKKIYISEIISWIDHTFLQNVRLLKSTNDSFTLSNKKLINKIKIKISKNQLKRFCKNLI